MKAPGSVQASTKDDPPETQKTPAPDSEGMKEAAARPAMRAKVSTKGTGVMVRMLMVFCFKLQHRSAGRTVPAARRPAGNDHASRELDDCRGGKVDPAAARRRC